MMQSTDAEESKAAAQMAVFWPNQKDRGAHVNVSGAGVTVAAKNKANAIKLLEFLVSEEAQLWYAKTNNEYPVVKEVQWSDTLKSWGTFKADALNLAKLGENNAQAVRLMDRVGWK
jgi:iron(III) transport system substrate-binding protein